MPLSSVAVAVHGRPFIGFSRHAQAGAKLKVCFAIRSFRAQSGPAIRLCRSGGGCAQVLL